MEPPTSPKGRLLSLDAYRGFTMLFMASEGLGIPYVAAALKDSAIWQFLGHQTSHTPWLGCYIWDLIQPSFTFIVGVAAFYSMRARTERGETRAQTLRHTLWRAFLLVLIGIFIRSNWSDQTNFTFEDVTTQIGLGYTFLVLLAWTKPRTQIIAFVSILIGYWALFAIYPVQPPINNEHYLQGFAAHWDIHTNAAGAFDRWFLNLFPRPVPFVFNDGGYQTLSFIPSLATMLLGLLAGGVLGGQQPPARKLALLVAAGAAGLLLGQTIEWLGVCPIVKRIWTPSWVLFSGGWTFLLMAAFFWLVDMKGWKRWTIPLTIVGMNSIAIYCMSWLLPSFIIDTIRRHAGHTVFQIFGSVYEPIVSSVVVVLVLWLIVYWMYKRKLFLRI